MERILPEDGETQVVDSPTEIARMSTQIDALTKQLAELKARTPGHTGSRPDARKANARAIRNMVALVISIAVLTVLANAPIVHGQSVVDALFIDANGNVGIGTSSPQRRLDITSSGGDDVAGISIESFIAFPNAGSIRFGDNTGWKLHIGRSREEVAGPLNSGTEGALMTIQDNGNVGIGTTDPGKTLEVAGNIVSRNTAEDDGTAVALAAEGGGLASIWTNPSYNPTNPGSGWLRTIDMQGGNVDVAGDLTVQGNITNFALSGPYESDVPRGDKYTPMVPQGNGFCFLTDVSCDSTGAGYSFCSCSMFVEEGRWKLAAATYPVVNQVANRTTCTAMCFTW